MKKILLTLAVILLIALIGIPGKLFFIGDPLDISMVHCTVSEHNGELKLHVSTPASAVAFRSWKYHQEGTILNITARKVLVSRFYSSGVYESTISRGNLTEIQFDGTQIWAAE